METYNLIRFEHVCRSCLSKSSQIKMQVDTATQFTGLTLPQLNITGDLKCHPLVLQHCQFNPQLMRFYLAGFVNILKECCCQCNEIFIWHKQLAKSGQVQICGLLLCFATIQIQTSSSLLEQVNLTTESLWNHVHFMKSKIFLQSWLTEMSEISFFKIICFLCRAWEAQWKPPVWECQRGLQHECASKD